MSAGETLDEELGDLVAGSPEAADSGEEDTVGELLPPESLEHVEDM